MKFANGSIYDGHFNNDEMHGQGTYIWPDERKYVGEWDNSQMNGKGVLTWPDG